MRHRWIRGTEGRRRRCWSRACASSSTAAMTRPASRSPTAGRMQVVRCRGKLSGLEDMVAREPPPRQRRHRPHALGDARAPVGDQRPPAQDRLGRGRAQRHHREPPGAARAPGGGRAQVLVGDRHRDRRAPDRRGAAGGRADAGRRRCARRCAQVEGAYALAVVSEKHPGQIVAAKIASPLVHRPRQGRDLPGLRRAGVPRAHARGDLPRRGRRRRDHQRGRQADQPRRHARRPRRRAPSPGTPPPAEKGGYPHFMLKEIHEQPRAIADTLRGAPAARDARRRPGRVRDRRARAAAGRAARLRDLVPRRAGRQVPDRGRGAHPVRGRPGQRVPLPRSGRRPRRPGHRHLAERRDRRHAGRGEGGARARRRVLAICNVVDSAIPRASHGVAVHARRARDRRRVDQVLHRAAGGAGAGGDPPRAPHRDADARRGRQADDRVRAASRTRWSRRWRGWATWRSSRRTTRTRATSCSSGAAPTTRSRSRARSS